MLTEAVAVNFNAHDLHFWATPPNLTSNLRILRLTRGPGARSPSHVDSCRPSHASKVTSKRLPAPVRSALATSTPPVEIVPVAQLFCSPTNPRHNDVAVPHVAASIRRFGWQQPIVARRSGDESVAAL